jgi:two-component system CheB/CheR fusion protein
VRDFAGRILAWNRRAQEMYGHTKKEALELNPGALIPEKNRKETRGLIERLKRGEQVPPCETRRRTRDGREIRVWLTTSALPGESGNPASIATTDKEI